MAQGASETPPNDVLHVQHQIRANAAELQDYFADLYKWEKAISQEEAARKEAPPPRVTVPLPRRRSSVTVTSTPSPVDEPVLSVAAAPEKRADAHTYDKGYKKWEKFDVDAALRDDDDGHAKQVEPPFEAAPATKKQVADAKEVSPSSLTTRPSVSVAPTKPREEIEREDGNEHYKRGDYVAAIKSYTRALGFNSRNVVVLSNRAMAYLKNKEYSKAEDDCSLALKIDETHVKSYSRRGTARNALGKHRLALLDFERALQIDPKSKQTASQVTATKELLRTAIKRAPKRTEFAMKVIGDATSKSLSEQMAPTATSSEDKENAPRVANKKIVVIKDTTKGATAEKNADAGSVPFTPSPPVPPAPTAITPAAKPAGSVGPPLPRVPKKAPTSSYEFLRVWKTLAPKGELARGQQLLRLRADYLRLLAPTALPSVFKNSIEAELLCDIFATIHQVMDVSGGDKEFITSFVTEFTRVPRFSMVVMFLSDSEKADIARVMQALEDGEQQSSDTFVKLQDVKALYGLK